MEALRGGATEIFEGLRIAELARATQFAVQGLQKVGITVQMPSICSVDARLPGNQADDVDYNVHQTMV